MDTAMSMSTATLTASNNALHQTQRAEADLLSSGSQPRAGREGAVAPLLYVNLAGRLRDEEEEAVLVVVVVVVVVGRVTRNRKRHTARYKARSCLSEEAEHGR